MKIGIIGLGKLGLPVAVAIAYKGHEVYGYDPKRMNKDNFTAVETGPDGRSPFQPYLDQAKINFGSMQYVVDNSDIIFVAIQTPHTEKYEGITRIPSDRQDFDYTFLKKGMEELSSCYFSSHKTVVIISTCLPGTIRREIMPNLNSAIELVYNPFFIAMGTVMKDFLNPEFVLLGTKNKYVSPIVSEFYKTLHDRPLLNMSIESAELSKVLYNTYIGMKIVFANTAMEICHKTPNANINDVTAAIKHSTDRLISPAYLTGGMGDGGGCFLGDQIVYTKDGPREIETIEVGDYVLAKDGKLERVIETYKRPYKGKILKIKARGTPYICVTPEHPFHVVKDGRRKYISNGIEKYDNTKDLREQLGPIEQIQAGELNKDYYIMFPKPKMSPISFEGHGYYLDEYLEVAGYYLSEGSVWIRKDRGNKPYRVEFTMHEEEQEDLNRIETLLKAIYPNIYTSRIKKPDSKAETLRVNSVELAERLFNDFGHLAEGKRIPSNLLYGHLHHSTLLLKGLWRGDGSSHKEGFSYSTTSKDLAYGVSIILRRLEIPHTLQTYEKRVGADGIIHLPSFEVRVRNAAYIEKLANLLSMPIEHQMQEKQYSNVIFEKDNYFYHKIDEIEILDYEGTVYNLNVENSHTYVCAAGLVDNCHPRDNIAMSWLANKLELSHNFFEDIMSAREDQTEWLARLISYYTFKLRLPVALLGKSFKPGTAICTGSPAMLLANLLKERDISFEHYDPYVDGDKIPQKFLDMPYLYLISTKHEDFRRFPFHPQSTVIDPHRYVPTNCGCHVIPIGIGPVDNGAKKQI